MTNVSATFATSAANTEFYFWYYFSYGKARGANTGA